MLLDVLAPIAGLFPDRGLRRGRVVVLAGRSAATSLLLAILAGPVAHGAWGGVVGMPHIGLEAAAGFGVTPDRLLLVPQPGPEWPAVVATMLDALDLVAVSPPSPCRPASARRIATRAREHRSVLLIAPPAASRAPGPHQCEPAWPEAADLHLEADAGPWQGIGKGSGVLQSRLVTVRSSGRRSSGVERSVQIWLPAPNGQVALGGEDHVAHRGSAGGQSSKAPASSLAG